MDDVLGLGYWGGVAYGFTLAGSLIQINLMTGAGTVIPIPNAPADLMFLGAGTTTVAPTTIIFETSVQRGRQPAETFERGDRCRTGPGGPAVRGPRASGSVSPSRPRWRPIVEHADQDCAFRARRASETSARLRLRSRGAGQQRLEGGRSSAAPPPNGSRISRSYVPPSTRTRKCPGKPTPAARGRGPGDLEVEDGKA